ncbi:MAG: PspC domain-containing protein [Bryobacteraceae bacterium]
MFCTKCGTELRIVDKFCFECGTVTASPRRAGLRLSRPANNRKISGVCAGFARYLGIDVTLARIVALVLLLWPVPLIGGIAYLIASIVMPDDKTAMPAAAPQASAPI